MSAKLEHAFSLIDEANRGDPQTVLLGGEAWPKAFIYGRRMSEWLYRLDPDPNEAVQLAARGQHIRRWEIPRAGYPATREGYLAWRTSLYRFHAEQMTGLLEQAGYDGKTIDLVARIVSKRGLKTDSDVQRIEDVACLVFLDHEFAAFAAEHEPEKLIGIVRKTWRKMSEPARAKASSISLSDDLARLVAEALKP
jgi:Domain of unknown function (DUF4202)